MASMHTNAHMHCERASDIRLHRILCVCKTVYSCLVHRPFLSSSSLGSFFFPSPISTTFTLWKPIVWLTPSHLSVTIACIIVTHFVAANYEYKFFHFDLCMLADMVVESKTIIKWIYFLFLLSCARPSSPGNCRRTHKPVSMRTLHCETRFLTLQLISSFVSKNSSRFLNGEICLISQCFIIRCENSRSFCICGHACLASETNWNRKWLWKFHFSFFIHRLLCCRISHAECI